MDVKQITTRKKWTFSSRVVVMFVLLSGMMLNIPCAAFATNWEGHDDWLTVETHAQVLRSHFPLAKPITHPYPLCAEREELHARNPYEQRPIAGINCIDTHDQPTIPLQ